MSRQGSASTGSSNSVRPSYYELEEEGDELPLSIRQQLQIALHPTWQKAHYFSLLLRTLGHSTAVICSSKKFDKHRNCV